MEANQDGSITIKASEFKAKCLKIMDEVSQSGEEVVITKNGRPVSKLVPYKEKKKGPFFGRDKGKIKIVGDIISPTGVEWSSQKSVAAKEEEG